MRKKEELHTAKTPKCLATVAVRAVILMIHQDLSNFSGVWVFEAVCLSFPSAVFFASIVCLPTGNSTEIACLGIGRHGIAIAFC